MTKVLGWILFLGVLSGCQTPPTKVYEKHKIDFQSLMEGAVKPIKISDETVVIDSRTSFEYTMAHIPGSVNLHWSEFALDKKRYPGKLKKNHFRIARRLALLGIAPGVPVVIVGLGTQGGGGEEGRLAWMLLYLGVQDVQMVHLNSLDLKMSNNVQETPPRKNAKMWKPKLVSQIEADRREVISAITGKTKTKTYIIDVRTQKEYFRKGGFGEAYSSPNIQAINIEWKEFYTHDGRPNFDLRKKLEAIGVQRSDRVLLISNQGQRSAAATVALLSMGFQKAANVSGGLTEVLEKPRNRFR